MAGSPDNQPTSDGKGSMRASPRRAWEDSPKFAVCYASALFPMYAADGPQPIGHAASISGARPMRVYAIQIAASAAGKRPATAKAKPPSSRQARHPSAEQL